MATSYQRKILSQIRDGKRAWSYAETYRDFDAFVTEVVEPLRQLKGDGVIPGLSEIRPAIGGRERITGVEIIGSINESDGDLD